MSSLSACNSVIENKLDLIGLLSIFTYGFNEAINNFKNQKIINYSLSSYDYLIEEAVKEKNIDQKDLKMLINWKENPKNWKS